MAFDWVHHCYFLYAEQPFKTGLGTSLTEEED